MSRILKIVGILVGVVVVVLIGAIVAVALLVDPNDYKGEITTAVNDATGRTLTLEGDLALDFFPRIGVALGAASLSNAPGFGDAPFASIAGAKVSVEVLPLIFGSVSVAEISLDGLRLNLARNARGVNNWQDLGGGATPPPAGAAPAEGAAASGAPPEIGVGSLRITDAEVNWSDASTGSDWMLTGFDFEASDFGLGESFPLSIAFNLAGAEMEVAIESEMNATIALAENSYRLDDLEVTIDGRGAGWPGGEGQATLAFDSFAANLNEETVELTNLRLGLLGLAISGTLQGRELFSNLTLAGAITSPSSTRTSSSRGSAPRSRRPIPKCSAVRARTPTSPTIRAKWACATCASCSTTPSSRARSVCRAKRCGSIST